MFSRTNASSLMPPNSDDKKGSYKQYLLPENILYDSHYGSTPNIAFYLENEIEQRRVSDVGPSLRLPNADLFYPGELGRDKPFALKQKNSSLTVLLDSTSSIMRTASTTFHCFIGSARRASYCGQTDPSIQLDPHGNSGSLYLLPTRTNSNESSLSNASYEEQRRTVTIYDGRIPAAASTPTIPFELMAPIDLITQTVDDPVESFVQIVLEEPDDRPPIMRPSLSSSRRNSGSRHRHRYHRSSSPKSSLINGRLSTSETQLNNDTQPSSVAEIFNSLEIHYQTPDTIVPMDFSFLEPVLRGESAAPPPARCQKLQHISPQNSSASEDSAIDIRSPSRTITIIKDDYRSSELFSDVNNDNYSENNSFISTRCLKVPSSVD
ncbi:unnamed protein product [Rotaria socialis]|uniref:Uncharacterized protein n=1 Tax=Rotaria socialis TaxID=392032 RepID=A0A817NW75_9BILA|nr:unnamed protein product [Rotaria socialis]CAF3288652.1 unnamed protein product [Rotaria socialis]CAF4279359.1 unnamed protein product [Rotaria socialis]CAF4334881.1 unnamed protein product [Rotaria socialis]